MFGNAIILIITYITIPLIIPPLAKLVKEKIKYALLGRNRSRSAIKAEVQKEGLNQKAKKRLSFTMKDPRKKPVPFKLIFCLIYGLGIMFSGGLGLAGYSVISKQFLLTLMIAYISFLFSIITANGIVKEREVVLNRMMDLKSSKMRLVNKEKGVPNSIDNEFKILKWNDDLVSPMKMEVFMPTDFDLLQVDGFLESFNLVFGSNGTWVADDKDGGFDFNAGIAHIIVSPKLPTIAMWHERYLNSKDIHWSYFPLALGSENGVPVVNEETGETERVLGFAVNGGQEKLSKKNGVLIGKEITSAPQILVAGGTGGGKALDSNSLVRVIVDDEEK